MNNDSEKKNESAEEMDKSDKDNAADKKDTADKNDTSGKTDTSKKEAADKKETADKKDTKDNKDSAGKKETADKKDTSEKKDASSDKKTSDKKDTAKKETSDKKDDGNKKDSTEKKDNTSKRVTEFIGGGPEFLANSVHINPKRVYYENNNLVMVAWVTNGFQSTVFNIHNVEIRLSNKEGVIAHGFFGELQGLQIGPGGAAEWTFVFSKDAVIKKDADLGYLKTESRTAYNY